MELQERIERYLESTLLRADAEKKHIKNFVKKHFVLIFRSLTRFLSLTVSRFRKGLCRYSSRLPRAYNCQNFKAEKTFRDGSMSEYRCAWVLKARKKLLHRSKEVFNRSCIKVIIETGYLTPDEIALACDCAVEGGAAFVKTSTGFGPRGSSVEDIRLLRKLLPPKVGIKAAGGIRSAEFARKLLLEGANRIGTSMAEQIFHEEHMTDGEIKG